MNHRPGRIDVVTIFPAFFDALDVSLIGKARQSGSLQVGVHDLREWTTDRHRSVDDTPVGGGAGMVMRADVWGSALDDIVSEEAVLLIPTPAGEVLTQRVVQELSRDIAAGQQLVIACGRYEGIDARVSEHYRTRLRVREVSIGDYVLNGGEAAALVIIEAVGRLLPGIIGNPESLVEESHGSAGLLEYPVYTQPVAWRNLSVPAVLRSGDHQKVSSWRREQAVDRTARERPDLMERHEVLIRRGKPSDAARLHEVARHTFILACPPDFPTSTADAFVEENLSERQFRKWAKSRDAQLWVAEVAQVIVGYAVVALYQTAREIPGQNHSTTADLNKMYVLPHHHGTGVARSMMEASLDGAAQAGMKTIWLGVNQLNIRAQEFYSHLGFAVVAERTFNVGGSIQGDFVMQRTLDFPERR